MMMMMIKKSPLKFSSWCVGEDVRGALRDLAVAKGLARVHAGTAAPLVLRERLAAAAAAYAAAAAAAAARDGRFQAALRNRQTEQVRRARHRRGRPRQVARARRARRRTTPKKQRIFAFGSTCVPCVCV